MLTLFDLQRLFPRADETSTSVDIQQWIGEYFEHVRAVSKHSSPFLGQEHGQELPPTSPFPTTGRPVGEIRELLFNLTQGAVDWANPTNAIAPSAPPTSVAILSALLCAHLNPNLSHGSYGQIFSEMELRLASMLCGLVNYDSRAAGFSTFGAAGSMYYAARAGLERARRANPGISWNQIRIIRGAHSHVSSTKAAAWLGLDDRAVITTPSISGRIDLAFLRKTLRELISSGDVVACIFVEIGSTFDFALDDVGAVVEAADLVFQEYGVSYRPYVHADAAIAGIYSVFATYDIESNPLKFSARVLDDLRIVIPPLRALKAADSIGIDFHKLGFCPLTSAMHLLKDRNDLKLFVPEGTDASAKIWPVSVKDYEPSIFTMESSRSATGVLAAYANIFLLGRTGYQQLLGHSLELCGQFRSGVAASPYCRLLNDFAAGPAIVFRVYPTREDARAAADILSCGGAEKANAATTRVFSILSEKMGIPTFSLLQDYSPRMVGANELSEVTAIKGYFISPNMTVACVLEGIKELHRACEQVGTENEG